MADAKPSPIHGKHEGVPSAGELPPMPETIRLIEVSGKAVKLVGETKLACGTIRRDYA